jgi:D-sedoheptulose 7-phosphate isomerase
MQQEMQDEQLRTLLTTRFEQSMTVPEAFFALEAPEIAKACEAMVRRFHQGGRLLAFGNGAWATDAQHVSVEFVHPVIVGKRALPALALTNDSATLSGLLTGDGATQSFAHLISTLGRTQDIALGFSPDGNCANIIAALTKAQQMGMLTLGLVGGDGGLMQQSHLNFCFTVQADDPLVIQEVHETLYHVLWELVHVFFEHEGLLQ